MELLKLLQISWFCFFIFDCTCQFPCYFYVGRIKNRSAKDDGKQKKPLLSWPCQSRFSCYQKAQSWFFHLHKGFSFLPFSYISPVVNTAFSSFCPHLGALAFGDLFKGHEWPFIQSRSVSPRSILSVLGTGLFPANPESQSSIQSLSLLLNVNVLL